MATDWRDDGSFVGSEDSTDEGAYYQAFNELCGRAFEDFGVALMEVVAACPGVRVFATDSVGYLGRGDRAAAAGLALPPGCTTFRLRRAGRGHTRVDPRALSRVLSASDGVVAAALEPLSDADKMIGRLPLERLRHLRLGGIRGLRDASATSALVVLDITLANLLYLPDVAVLRQLVNLRQFAIRCASGVLYPSAVIAQMAETLGCTVAADVRMVYERMLTRRVFGPRFRTPLADIVEAVANRSLSSPSLRHLTIEAGTVDLGHAAAALDKLRTICDSVGVRLDLVTMDD